MGSSDTPTALVRVRLNDIDEDSATTLQDKVYEALAVGQSVLPVEIDSAGGCCYALCAMIAALEAARRAMPVATIACGKAFSSGAFLLACGGTKGLRYAAPTASIMVHQVSARLTGTHEDLKVDMRETARLNKQLMAMLGKATGMGSKHFIEKLRDNKDWYMTPAQALSNGLVDHVEMPLFVMKSEASVVVA